MKKDLTENLLWRFLALPVPFVIWLVLFKDLTWGREAFINADTFDIYGVIKFFLDNLREGVYPLWNPFVQFGFPYIHQMGEYNPVLLVILGLNTLGLSFYHSFLWVMLGYFFVGLMGFYLLAEKVIGDKRAALAAYLFLLFSSFGPVIFNQLTYLLIYVPAVWFFYFLVRFLETGERKFFLGITAALVLIFTTYLPFYFVTVYLFSLALYFCLFPRSFQRQIDGLLKFCRSHKAVSFGTVFFVLLSAGSLFRSYLTLNNHMGILTRHTVQEAKCTVGVDFNEVAPNSSLQGPLDLGIWGNKLKTVDYENDRFLYISFFFYLLLALSAWVRFDRRTVFLAGLALFIFLLCLGKATPLYAFLFHHVFYFKFFRNIYLLLPFALSVMALLAAYQLKAYLKQVEKQGSERKQHLLWILVVHLVFFVILFYSQDALLSSYLTVGASLLFFVLYWTQTTRMKTPFVMMALSALIFLQPAEFLSAFQEKTRATLPVIREGVTDERSKPQFAYLRPGYKEVKFNNNEHEIFSCFRRRKDAPGFLSFQCCYPTIWSYEVAVNLPTEIIGSYVRYKFIVYDRVRELDDNQLTLSARQDFFEFKEPAAYVACPSDVGKIPREQARAEVLPISGPSNQFEVLKFWVNGVVLRTNFPQDKFLVYNDSFHPDWKAFLNGKEVPIYRTNTAFKGIWIPQGENAVRFVFSPWGGEVCHVLILFLFWGFFGYCIYIFLSDSKKPKHYAA